MNEADKNRIVRTLLENKVHLEPEFYALLFGSTSGESIEPVGPMFNTTELESTVELDKSMPKLPNLSQKLKLQIPRPTPKCDPVFEGEIREKILHELSQQEPSKNERIEVAKYLRELEVEATSLSVAASDEADKILERYRKQRPFKMFLIWTMVLSTLPVIGTSMRVFNQSLQTLWFIVPWIIATISLMVSQRDRTSRDTNEEIANRTKSVEYQTLSYELVICQR